MEWLSKLNRKVGFHVLSILFGFFATQPHFFAAISLRIPWDYFDKLDTTRIERHHVRRLEQLGYTVTLTPKENEAA